MMISGVYRSASLNFLGVNLDNVEIKVKSGIIHYLFMHWAKFRDKIKKPVVLGQQYKIHDRQIIWMLCEMNKKELLCVIYHLPREHLVNQIKLTQQALDLYDTFIKDKETP